MQIKDCETLLIGSIKELVQNKKYFHASSVGNEYCYLTEEGKELVYETINMFGPRLLKAIEQEDIERSKKLVFDGLKK